jgi:GINS complex subunit 4
MSSWGPDSSRPLPSFLDRLENTRDRDDDGDDPMRNEQADFVLFPDADETPLQQLIRHWMNERHAPDILSTQDDLLTKLLDHIRKQVGE